MDLKEENAEMKAKLADRLRKSKTESKVEDRLAKMAGIKKDLMNNDDTEHSDEYDTESDEDSENNEEAGGSKITGKMRSDEVRNDIQNKAVKKNSDIWKHDKFDKDDDDRGSKRSDGRQFGKHWGSSKSKKGRSKDRSNSRSRSRSRKRSESKSSRSRSRSRSRDKRRRKRRGKFSASRSRSSSSAESSRSRSRSRRRSYSSRSESKGRTSSRSKSRKSENNNKPVNDDSKENPDKEGINLELSGALTADSNTVNGSGCQVFTTS